MNSEKVSVNINDDRLAKIDLLVSEGFYANRSAFINEAVSKLLEENGDLIDKIISESNKTYSTHSWFIGVQNLSKDYLEDYLNHGVRFSISGFGVLFVDSDVTADLLKATVTRISGKIRVRGSEEVLEYIKTINK
ncbi:MAG: hypothetical protein II126_01005 [Erysipelotrichaceae bacterium]|nr:hypothetical protein [Erysipelotrichaceae bacterium]